MRTYSEERPSPVTVSAGIREWYLTVNIDIKETEGGYEYYTHTVALGHAPTEADIKAAIDALINARTDERILSGFVWNGNSVWLSDENQRNFSEAQRVAMITNGQSLPMTFKLGEDANGNPVYHEFITVEELTGFYLAAVGYINERLKEGWNEKDNIDIGNNAAVE